MNQLSPYEQMIAEEMEGIEIPDMADAIWDRIAPVLDVEMPVNETPATPGNLFFKDPAVWMISAGILAIIVLLFLLSRHRRTAPPPQKELPQQTKPIIKPDTIRRQDFIPPDRLQPAEKNKRTTNEKQVVDTVAQSTFIKEKTDSFLKLSPIIKTPPVIKIPPPGMNPSLDLKPRPKYGVEVSDSDYRFNIKPKE